MRLGKRASRKSLKPDRSRPKSVYAEHVKPRAHFEAVEHSSADEVLKHETASAPEDLQDLSESAGPANPVLGNGVDSPINGVAGTLQEEVVFTKVDLITDISKEESASALRNVVADRAAEDLLSEVEEFSPDINKEESTGASLTNQTDASIIVHVSRSTVHTAQTTEDGKETITTSTSSPENTETCAKTTVLKMPADHFTGCIISDDMNPIPIVNVSADSMALLLKDSQTHSKGLEEASTIISPESARNQSDSLSNSPYVEVEEHSPLPTAPETASPADLYCSPKFSLGAPKPDVTVNEQLLKIVSSEDVYSKEDDSNPFESARSEPGDKTLIESPFAQRRRHSVRLSLEELTPEEITEASVVFHDYTGTKEAEPTGEAPLDQLQSRTTAEDTCQTPPWADPIAAVEGGEISEEPVEVAKGKTRSGARFSDDTNMLIDFLSRAQARKLTQPSNIPMSAPKPLASPRRTPRKALAELDSNSPSTQRHSDIVNRPGTPPGKGKLGGIDFDNVEEGAPEPTSCRRSTRTRSTAPPKTTPSAPSFIPVRRADGTDPVVLQKSAAQELTIVTRANTRRNKGQAKIPSLTLQNRPTEGLELTAVKHGNKDAKSVGWDEKLVYFQNVTESTVVQEEKRPRVRRLRGLGAVNGTPAPKKMMADINIGTPASKRRGKIR